MKLLTTLILLTSQFLMAGAEPKSAADSKAGAPGLPLSEIILYSSGVGYFQRDGEIEGRAQVDLRFKVEDINDLLKSMVVQDLDGGRVSTVTYGSRDPLTKTLKSFGLNLTDNPTLGELLNQVRGERVEILRPNPLVGTILGVEKKLQPLGEDKQTEVESLNLLTEDGLQSVPLAQIQRIKLLNEGLNAELKQALEVLAGSHDTQKKTVALTFEGEGKRKVSVAYISETPVWKTSYRLVLDDREAPFLQGWAIIENTTDEDWNNVRLALVSGRPISFTMDLYQPLYTTRPVVELELYASLRPPVYGDALEEKQAGEALAAQPAPALAMAPNAKARSGGPGFGGGAGARSFGGLAVEGLPPGRAERASNLQRGVVTAAQAAETGELFQYTITTPVTLSRQKAAMLPIVSQKVEGEKVSIYNPTVQAKHPLNGFRLKNSTPLHLMQGPITVFDSGTYAGDARIEDLAPDQERLLSYALDLKTEVEVQAGDGQQELLTVSIKKGTLVSIRKALEEKTYNIKNRDQKKKSVIIEHPFRSDWKLMEPKESSERSRDAYRFVVNVDSGKGTKLVVREEKQLTEQVQLVNFATDSINYYLRSQKVSAKIKEVLEKVVALRDRLNQTSGERARREQRVNEITQEQARIRENMSRLAQTSELYNRYVKKLDQQETELENLRKEIESHKATEAKQQQELNDYLLNLDVA